MLSRIFKGPRALKRSSIVYLAIAGLLLVALACGGSASNSGGSGRSDYSGEAAAGPEKPTPGDSSPEAGEEDAAPVISTLVDRSNHSVPLGEIVFDTFGTVGSRYVPLDEATDQLILNLRDAITPVSQPIYGDPAALGWLGDDDLVIGYESAGEAFAYPINILNFHEIVNDTIGGIPVLITYCPLCFSGVVFSREVDGETLTFGNTSALYQSDLVMYDHQSGSYWFQTGGEAVVGPRTGSRLKPLPSTTMPWGEWRTLYPATKLITGADGLETRFGSGRYGSGFGAGYQEQINDGQFAFPVDEEKLDGRLPAGEIVLTVEAGESVMAFPLGIIGDAAVNSEVGGLPVAVFTKSGGASVGAFSREVDGRALNFDYLADADRYVDRETGTSWDATGTAVEGELAGNRLDRLSTRRAFWFSIAISFPEVELFQP